MFRYLYKDLLRWQASQDRKPLVLFGARQVGKTWLLKDFGQREYKNLAYVSFDRDEAACQLMITEKNAKNLLRGLSAITGIDIVPGETLVVLDEVQDCPIALTRMKALNEDAPEYHVAACGSLLGIALHEGISYPVGMVHELYLHPMTFGEFLLANGKEKLEEILTRCDWGIINSISSEYIDLLRQYYYVGGMPAAVKAYVDGKGLNEVRNLQKLILNDYDRDFSKHAPAQVVPRIRMVWQNIVSQLVKENKKFIFGAMKKGARASEFELAIQWLIDAGIVYKVKRVTSVKMPLKFYEDNDAFKLFILDVGLMGAMADVPASQIMVSDNIFKEYKGAFTEAYVESQLATTGIPVYFHTVEKSRIELDFVVQLNDNVYPVEVKAEENVKAKSMKVFIGNHPELKGIRLSMKNHENQSWIENIPLFAFRDYLKQRACTR
ncbi:MAG: ATP-binding protein [Bacteroidales bacterium]|nr:ATP-binding protein [Candidatus Sodaliphilus limicaballi]